MNKHSRQDDGGTSGGSILVEPHIYVCNHGIKRLYMIKAIVQIFYIDGR